ncbi:ral GTPase-activating protein subunit beta [Achroia grisella]|uniref:ral GTPase-activating protein subunit beta n=1 Tax=Achroia grisella TaxID=688607 RepID=UPI0027D2627B|nr:ral GTPase-activating protein subunit beta [Achroia grisella]
MNVGIFNIVNHKNKESGGMYEEWSSLPLEGGGQGVLKAVGGRDVVLAVMRQLASHEPSPLTSDAEVEWVLEVVRFGLALPLSEHEALRDCVRVCCAWLAPLLPAGAPQAPPPPATPPPVLAQPHRYARKLLRHLQNLFLPRPDESGDLISKQALLCHRVLRLARSLAGGGALGAAEWRALLALLLAAAAALLAPPAPHHAAADQLTDRVLCVLFEVWILACHRCFPSPPLWRTLREQCIRWRHRAPLTEQWTRASLCLTARLLKHMYGPTFPAMPISEEDSNLVPADMSAEAVMQSWYRMLHTIGNPVDLCRPHVISQTPDFLQYSMSGGTREPWQHPCLAALPAIFHKAMRGLAAHVDAFLGRGAERWWVECGGGGGGGGGAGSGGAAGGAGGAEGACEEDTPPAHRRLAKSFSVSTARPRDKPPDKSTPRTSLIGLTGSRPPSVAPTTPPNSISSQVCETEKPPLAPLRPKVNSIFHLFGEWLFEAALIGTTPAYNNNQQRADGTPPPPSISDAQYKLNMLSYQAGRAEALGAVCRVLCSKQSREEVLAPYLARCLAALRHGLRDPNVAAAVVLNAPDIFRLDLDGVLVLVPDYITTLDRILSEREPKLECGGIDKRELRKAAISALLSLVAFPYHYRGLPVPEFPGCNEYAGTSLGELTRARLAALCVAAVQVEWSASLAAPLLSALYLCVRHHAPPETRAGPPPLGDARARSDSGSATGSDGHSSLEDFAADVRELDPSSPVFGAALVVRATYLVCHRLISSWKGDLQVSLAALELLSGLAKLHSAKPEATERKRAVRWVCDYISVQCGRPPPAHSRDLHSCVVAAYSCLAAWLCPALLADAACLAALMEVVELGISGAKSQPGKPGEQPKMKDEKELKPVSMRVRDAAESLLMLILEQTGTTAGGGGEGWCRLDERWLAALGHGKLRHYVADGSVLLSLLEEPLANSQEPQPTLIVIIRCGWGRYAWSLSSRGAARCATRGGGAACPRPVDMLGPAPRPAPACLPLPPAPPCAVDSAFPTLDSVLRQLNDPDAPILFKLLEQQANIEKRVKENEDNVVPEEYVPPEPVTEFQTARLFLSHFGYLNIGGDKKGGGPRLTALRGWSSGLAAALRRLDGTGARAALTAHVFCARAGRAAAAHMLADVRRPRLLPPPFLRMLRGLGTAVRVRGHGGWAGHAARSYDAQPPDLQPPAPALDDGSPAVYDGRQQVGTLARSAARPQYDAQPPDLQPPAPALDDGSPAVYDGRQQVGTLARSAARPQYDAQPPDLQPPAPALDDGSPAVYDGRQQVGTLARSAARPQYDAQPPDLQPPAPALDDGSPAVYDGRQQVGTLARSAARPQYDAQPPDLQPPAPALDDGSPAVYDGRQQVGTLARSAARPQYDAQPPDLQPPAPALDDGSPAVYDGRQQVGTLARSAARPQYDAQPPDLQPPAPALDDGSPAVYDGRQQILYWADATNEIAFIVPSAEETDTETEDRQNDSIKSDVDGSCISVRSSASSVGGGGGSGASGGGADSCWDVSGTGTGDKTRALSLDLDQNSSTLSGSGRRNRDFTTKILIIWLEDFEDHLNLQIDELLRECETGVPWRRHDVCVLCVSAHRSGLVRVKAARACGALPDGALLAPHLLPDCLRRAALDAARRARLHTDLYQPPHVRRRHLIQELAQNYKMDLTEPELLESLFKPPP